MQTVISRLLILAQNLGVRILTGARVSELKSDNHKRITGVIAKHLEKRQLFTSRMGVILATGGFGRNVELMSQFSPRMKFVTSLCAQGARGDGLLLATQQEAALSDMEYLEGSYAFIKNPTTINDMSLLPYYGAIVINQRGERFVDESLPYKQIAKKVLYQPRGESSLVFDEYIRNLALKEKLDNHLWAPIDKGVLPDYVVKSSTVAGAAEKAGLDAITLVKTVTDYNRNVESDSPPRGPLSVNGGKLVQLIHPPFYIMPASVSILGTYCGVRIDGEARVLRADDTPIQGLWAAGEVTGGFHGASFIMGTAIAKAFVFGRVAVDSIVRRSAYA